MGLQIRTYVNGNQEFIELYGNEDIEMEVSFAEIQDITKKNSAFTKEFKVPGSKNNNYIFNYFFDLNQSFTNWNPKKKFEADLIYDGYELYNGYVRLNSVSINKIEKVYSITFYSAIGDLVANIGDLALCNVDTSSLNHTLYDANIASNLFFDPSLHNPYALNPIPTINPINTGQVQYVLGQRGYDYTGTTYRDIRDINTANTPLLDFSGVTGFFDFSGSPVISSYLIPSIRTRTLYELIVNQAGYFIESNFFDSDYFGRYYIPLSFNTEQPFMAQASTYKYKWVNTSGDTNSYSKLVQNFTAGTTSNVNWFRTREIIEENFEFNPLEYSDYSATTLTANELTYMFALPYSNGQPFTFEAKIKATSLSPFGTFPFVYSGGTFQLWRYSLNGTPLIANLVATINYPVNLAASGITVQTILTGTTTPIGQINGTDLYFLSYTKTSGLPFKIIEASFEIKQSPVILPYTIELYKEMSCDQKQIDFIQNINKTFNLVVVEHPTKTKTLIIEPMVDYIGKGELLDWSDKVDYDATQNVYPTTNLINGTIFAANKQDKDYINTEYQKRSNKIFGQNQFDLNIDYKNQTTNLTQTLGQNTDYYLNASGTTNIALPCYFISKEQNNNGISTFEYRPFRSIPRQVFSSIPISIGNTKSNPFFYRYDGTNVPFTPIGLKAVGSFPNYNRLTTYPYAIKDFSHYTIYDSSNTFTSDELIYPTLENQYDRYYKDYIDDLTDDENKIYQVSMYLTPWEVAGLYFNETIMIKNTKFRINKISGLSLLTPGMCNVELVKLTRDYKPTPVLFYDLISCDNPCDVIHTNTDLIYPIWAFEGQYVALSNAGTGCTQNFTANTITCPKYRVIRTEYNESYTYTIPYLQAFQTQTSSYYISWEYATYDSCSATTPNFTLKVIDETTTPYTGNCVSMIITNTGTTQNTFQFKYCDGVSGSWTLDPSSAITLCGLYASFQTTGFSYCVSSFTPCVSWTPLPTPTPTQTPYQSPTITPTPSKTPGISPTTTPTPTATPSVDCRINTVLNITETGYIKYTLCTGIQEYAFVSSTGSYTITPCIQLGSVLPGFPFADVAVFTITNNGTSC